MKERVTELIREFVRSYQTRPETTTVWGEPLIGFADAVHSDISSLRDLISPSHKLPDDILSSAAIVICYFVPFTEELAGTNRSEGELASPEWALAYEETNAMFRSMNKYLTAELSRMGYEAAVAPEASTFDREKLISNWSQRHIARIAGLGTFGLNNMLITVKGCCGRYGSVVTNLDVLPDRPLEVELCIYKKSGSCGACIRRCPSGALSSGRFERSKCYRVLKKNAERYTGFGNSYFEEIGEKPNSIGSDVCGKCATNVPCSFFKP